MNLPDGIVCGHIHTPEDKQIGEIHSLKSGDWVESLTAIFEHIDGRMELVRYEEFLNSLNRTATESNARSVQPVARLLLIASVKSGAAVAAAVFAAVLARRSPSPGLS